VISLRTETKLCLSFTNLCKAQLDRKCDSPNIYIYTHTYIYFFPKSYKLQHPPSLRFWSLKWLLYKIFSVFSFSPSCAIFWALFPLSIPKQKEWWEWTQSWKCVLFNVSKIDFFILGSSKEENLKYLKSENTGGFCNECPILLHAKHNQSITSFCWKVFPTCLPLIIRGLYNRRISSLLSINTFLWALLSVLDVHGAGRIVYCVLKLWDLHDDNIISQWAAAALLPPYLLLHTLVQVYADGSEQRSSKLHGSSLFSL